MAVVQVQGTLVSDDAFQADPRMGRKNAKKKGIHTGLLEIPQATREGQLDCQV